MLPLLLYFEIHVVVSKRPGMHISTGCFRVQQVAVLTRVAMRVQGRCLAKTFVVVSDQGNKAEVLVNCRLSTAGRFVALSVVHAGKQLRSLRRCFPHSVKDFGKAEQFQQAVWRSLRYGTQRLVRPFSNSSTFRKAGLLPFRVLVCPEGAHETAPLPG